MSPLPLTALLLAGCGSADRTPIAAPRPPAKPLVVERGSVPGTRLALLSLRRDGPRVVTAKVRLTIDRSAPHNSNGIVDVRFDHEIIPYTVDGMRLIDPVNGREHYVLEDEDEHCLCSSFDWQKPGSTVDLYAKFPAPPEDVTRVSLHVPNFPSFDDVRIDP